MTKQQILELTGLSEDQFYDQYPDQESFCQDYPDACAQLQQAQVGLSVGEKVSPSLRGQIGVNTQGDVGVLAYTPQVQPMVRDEYGTLRRPRTHDRMGRPIGPMVQTFDKIPVVNQPGGYINPEFEGYASNEPATGWQTNTGMWSRPSVRANTSYVDKSITLRPLKVLAPIVNNYNLPKELVKANLQTVPLKDFGSAQTLQKAMTPMQTMYNVGSTGAPSSTSLNKFSSVVDLLKSKGKESSFAERKKLAETYGIKNYTGSAAQNMQLMDYVSKMKQGGIYINPANKGKFTESANRAGMGVQEFARHVLANKEDYSTTQIRRANFARNASKWKHEEGGELEQYQRAGQYPRATTQDSLILYRNQLEKDRFYKNNPDYTRNLTRRYYKDKENKYIPRIISQLNNVRSLVNAADLNLKFGTNKSQRELEGRFGKVPNANTVYSAGDIFLGFPDDYFNPAAPPSYFSNVIAPATWASYSSNRTTDSTDVPMYDPIAIKPAHLKTSKDWEYLEKKYGKPNVNVESKPSLKRLESVRLPMVASEIDMQGLPIVAEQQIGRPIYGPGRTLIAYSDEEGNVAPVQYSGAPSSEMGLLDKTLLENPEEFRKYIKKLGSNYKFKNDVTVRFNMDELRQGGQPCYECGGIYERGGTAIFPAMRTMFKHGGYYGMDGKFHRNTDSGTYVTDGGYYFQAGGGAPVTPSTPPTTGASVDIPANQGWSPAGDGGFNIDTNFQYDVEDENQTDPALGGGMDSRQSRRRRSSDLYETPDLGGLTDEYQTDEQPMDEQPVYDASQYSSAVDPSTGFTTWSKNNKQLTNIKKQDPALWAQLKEEGRGARFRTGQTDIQKFGRAAGKIANTMQAGVELAGAIGNVLNERNRRRNMDAAAMNMGSTAAMFTNPQSAGKGDYGVTGSSYGTFKPYSTGTLSYKGMYGRYGMQVPKYAVGGYTPDIATLSDYGLEGKPEVPEVEFRDFSNITTPFISSAPIVSPVDNLRVAYNQQKGSSEPITVKYDFKKPLGKGLDVSGNSESMKELFTYAQETYGSPDKATITGINEMAWNKMGVYDKGKYNPKGRWKNHDNHIHFGFENPDVAIDIINKAQSLGLRASENPYVDNVDPVHTKGSFHYSVFNKSDFITPKTSYEIPFMNYGKASTIPNPNEKDIATKLNNPGNILYNPAFEKFGATQSSILATDSGRPFAAFPSIEAGLKARETQLFGEVDGTFQSKYYKPNTDIDFALRRWSGGLNKDGTIKSNKGYGVEIYPELRGKKLKDITPAERRELMKRQIKRESGSMFKKLQKSGIFKMGGEQLGGQVVEMDEDQIQQFLAAGGQLEFID